MLKGVSTKVIEFVHWSYRNLLLLIYIFVRELVVGSSSLVFEPTPSKGFIGYVEGGNGMPRRRSKFHTQSTLETLFVRLTTRHRVPEGPPGCVEVTLIKKRLHDERLEGEQRHIRGQMGNKQIKNDNVKKSKF